MNFLFKALAAAACSLAVAGAASAHDVYRSHRHHAPDIRVQAYFGPAPVYVPYREVYVDPAWQERREWRRERAMRRAEWERREAWRRYHWRMEHRHRHRHHHGGWDDGRRY